MNVAEVLARQSAQRGGEPALVARGWTMSFAELDLASARWAWALYEGGLRPGDAALFVHPMSVELYVALAAVLRLGGVAMFLDPSSGRRHIASCCALRPPRVLIASPRAHGLRLLSSSLRRIPIKFSVGRALPGAAPLVLSASSPVRSAVEPVAPEAPALLSFTTGTTGEPKPVVRTHQFLLAQHRAVEAALSPGPGDLYLTALPLFVLANLASGAGSLLPDADLRRIGTMDPGPVLEQIDAARPTGAIAPPAFYERLAETPGRSSDSLKKVFTGGAPVYPVLLERLQQLAPRASIVAVYGSTEAEPMARIGLDEIGPEDRRDVHNGKGLLAGFPIPGLQMRIVGGSPGQPGEIVVRGDHVLTGHPSTTLVEDGVPWHRTGDAGYFDGRGRLWLLGRLAARIDDARGVIYPLSVEGRAHRHEEVRRAALVAHRGRRLLAVELAARSLDTPSLRAALTSEGVDSVLVLDRLPMDARHHSKIDYTALAKLLEKRP